MNFNLKPHTILLTLAGSRAYGTNTFTSDVDLKGVCVPPKEFYLGTKRFEQADAKDVMQCFLNDLPFELEQSAVAYGMEGTVFEVRRFLALAAEANPNILDVLFCRDEDVLLSTPAGDLLRQHRQEFLTKKCLATFFGYSKSQMDRIETSRSYLLNKPTHKPTRAEFDLPERHEFPQDQVMAAMSMIKKKVDGWNIDFVDIDEATKIFVQDQIYQMLAELHLGSDERFFVAAKLLGYDTNFMDFIRKQREYDQAVKKWQAFQTWEKERNAKRAGMEREIGFDAKHGHHLARLVLACRTIFETGTLNVYNPDPWLLDIRNCKVPFDDLKAWYAEQRAGLAEIAAKSSLPARVDQEWLSDLAVKIVESRLA